MPYHLEQSGSGWVVVSDSGKRRSKRPLPKKRAQAQLRALYANDPHAKRKDACTCATLKGERIAPGVTRIRGNLCNVHGRYGPCDAAQGARATIDRNKRINAQRAAQGGGKGGRKPRAAAKPKKTEDQKRAEQEERKRQREAEREAKRTEQDAARRVERDRILGEAGIDKNLQGALIDARDGNLLTPASGAKLAEQGLAEQGADGTYRLSPKGMQLVNAAARGDAGKVARVQGEARDQVAAQRQRESERTRRQQERDAKRAEAEARRAARGAGSTAKPKKDEPKPQTPRRPAPRRSAGGGSRSPSTSSSAGNISRRAEARRRREERAQREAARQAERAQDRADRASEQTERSRVTTPALANTARRLSEGGQVSERDAEALIRNGLARRDRDGTLVLTSTGLRATRQKEVNQSPQMSVVSGVGIPGVTVPPAAISKTAQHLMQRTDSSMRGMHHRTHLYPHAGQGNVHTIAPKKEAVARAAPITVGMRLPPVQSIPPSFAVFKDARGQWRWITRTTTAFEDRDREVISTKALEMDVARADSDGKYGPLRWWHVGEPNPLDKDAPWGRGVDLGWCDFNALSGRTLIESGTFKNEEIARAVASKADQLEISPGFFHDRRTDPDADGVFHRIYRFERSLVPIWAGRASNLYTGLMVEGVPMEQHKERALKELGVSDETFNGLIGTVEQTEKAADQAGVRYKDADPILAALKAFIGDTVKEVIAEQTAPAAVEQPAVEEKATKDDGEGDMEVMAETPAVEEQAADDLGMEEEIGGLTLSPEDITAIGEAVAAAIQGALAPLVGAMDMETKMRGHLDEIKGLFGSYATTKDAEAAQTRAKVENLDQRLKELEGDQPEVRPSTRASRDPSTVITNDAALLAAVKASSNGAGPFDDIITNLGLGPQN